MIVIKFTFILITALCQGCLMEHRNHFEFIFLFFGLVISDFIYDVNSQGLSDPITKVLQYRSSRVGYISKYL